MHINITYLNFNQMNLHIGIMSGTSMDGIDAVLVDFSEGKVNVLQKHSEDFPINLKEKLDQLVRTFQTDLLTLGEIDHQLALCYAETVNNLINKAGVHHSQIKAIGCHGQTVFHSPLSKYPFTMQLGDGNLIAAKTKITTVTDFRRMDMALGGNGAPLAPAFHQAFLNSNEEKRGILNLGGIANLTITTDQETNVVGFDSGPANCLMDSWIYKIKNEKFDKGGDWAKSGKIIPDLLDSMLKEEYFQKPAPKSTGRELFNLNWLNNHLKLLPTYQNVDVQSTLLELTAVTVSNSLIKLNHKLDAIYTCGGGAYNDYLLERLQYHLPKVKISTTDELGVSVQLVESIAFAWLAMQRINKQAGNLPSVTGASQNTLLGAIYESK